MREFTFENRYRVLKTLFELGLWFVKQDGYYDNYDYYVMKPPGDFEIFRIAYLDRIDIECATHYHRYYPPYFDPTSDKNILFWNVCDTSNPTRIDRDMVDWAWCQVCPLMTRVLSMENFVGLDLSDPGIVNRRHKHSYCLDWYDLEEPADIINRRISYLPDERRKEVIAEVRKLYLELAHALANPEVYVDVYIYTVSRFEMIGQNI
jgi:hypothetical protein